MLPKQSVHPCNKDQKEKKKQKEKHLRKTALPCKMSTSRTNSLSRLSTFLCTHPQTFKYHHPSCPQITNTLHISLSTSSWHTFCVPQVTSLSFPSPSHTSFYKWSLALPQVPHYLMSATPSLSQSQHRSHNSFPLLFPLISKEYFITLSIQHNY